MKEIALIEGIIIAMLATKWSLQAEDLILLGKMTLVMLAFITILNALDWVFRRLTGTEEYVPDDSQSEEDEL